MVEPPLFQKYARQTGSHLPQICGLQNQKKTNHINIYIYSQSATHYPLFFFKLNWAPLLWYFHQQLSPVKKPHAMMVESVGVAPGGSWSMKAPDTFGIVPFEFSFQVFLLGKTNIPWIHDLFPYIVLMCFFPFSRMRSEGFPFIVGVWGWTCVRFVLLPRRRLVVANSLIRCHWAVHSHCDTILTFKVWKVEEVSHEMLVLASSSCRRRVVVANSLIRCHWAVHSHCDTILTFKVWKVEEVSHEMLVLAFPSHKMWGLFRVLRDRRNTLALCQCKRDVFSWQAQHFVMWPFAMSWQAQHFVTWRRCCFHESQWQWRANVTLLQISWQAQDLVIVLKSGGSFAKVIVFELCKNGFIRKTRTKSSIFELKVWNLKEVSHEMLVLTLQTFKVRGHFRVLRGRRKTLEAPWLKSWGSLARNARFGSLSLEKLRKPRTKCSFWKLVPWKVEEA